jgi:hypothetical protein
VNHRRPLLPASIERVAVNTALTTRYVSCDHRCSRGEQHASEDVACRGASRRARADAVAVPQRTSAYFPRQAIATAAAAAATANAGAAAVERAAAALAHAHAEHADPTASVDPDGNAAFAIAIAIAIASAAATAAARREPRRELVDVRLGEGRRSLVIARFTESA